MSYGGDEEERRSLNENMRGVVVGRSNSPMLTPSGTSSDDDDEEEEEDDDDDGTDWDSGKQILCNIFTRGLSFVVRFL